MILFADTNVSLWHQMVISSRKNTKSSRKKRVVAAYAEISYRRKIPPLFGGAGLVALQIFEEYRIAEIVVGDALIFGWNAEFATAYII